MKEVESNIQRKEREQVTKAYRLFLMAAVALWVVCVFVDGFKHGRSYEHAKCDGRK